MYTHVAIVHVHVCTHMNVVIVHVQYTQKMKIENVFMTFGPLFKLFIFVVLSKKNSPESLVFYMTPIYLLNVVQLCFLNLQLPHMFIYILPSVFKTRYNVP